MEHEAQELSEAMRMIARGVLPEPVYINPKKPLNEGQLTYLSPPIQRIDIEFKRYSLKLLLSSTSLNAVLALNTHRSMLPIKSFMQFQELSQILEDSSANPPTQSGTYSLDGPPVTGAGGGYRLRYSGHQMDFSADEFEELRGLFRLARQQPDVMAALARTEA
jgi:hypothetical protein